MKRSILILFLLFISAVLSLPHESVADDEKVLFAKSLMARDYDSTLPSMPIEEWLRSTIKKEIVIEWSPYVTDCGERTGNPKIDTERDMPLCAEVGLKEGGKRIGYLLLFIGTDNRGTIKDEARLYYGYMNWNNKQVTIKELGELEHVEPVGGE